MFAIREDGVRIKQCEYCGLGVVEHPPADPSTFYGDAYYVSGRESGYADYRLAAEHGLGWAIKLLGLLHRDGKILDIGCADGYLLRRQDGNFERFGIEVNPKMAEEATSAGIHIIARDLFEAGLAQRYEKNFDVITSIAVFEHLPDFAGGIATAIDMLKDDGILLFEVPVMSAHASNAVWLQSSFEHIYYPTGNALQNIVEERLKCHLVGAELLIKDYASTYAGFIVKSAARAAVLRPLLSRLLADDSDDLAALTIDERQARTHLRLMHMAQTSEASVQGIRELDHGEFTEPLIGRIAQLWAADLQRLRSRTEHMEEIARERDRFQSEAEAWQKSWRQKSEQLANETRRLSARLDVAQRDSRLNTAQASQAVIAEMERVTSLEAQLQDAIAKTRAAEDREARAKVRAEAEAQHRYVAAEAQLQMIYGSTLWRLTSPPRQLAARHPRAVRRLRQLAKLAYWTVRLKLFSKLREVKARRAAALDPAMPYPTSSDPDSTPGSTAALLPVAGVLPEAMRSTDADQWPDDRPLVSVVIPCFNYGHLVGEAIRSVEAQTFQDIEIIVVEGGSSSVESRRALAALAEQPSTKVRILLQEKPYRAGANRNFGISHARGKYVCCLDADDRLAPTYLEKALFMLESYDYDVVSPALQFFGERSDVFAPCERPDLDMLVHGNHVVTCAVFRRSLWQKAGGYRDSDPTTGHLHEDWLFWVRIAALGARFLNLREPLFFYRSHGATLSNSDSVLDNELQAQLIRQFNADVLTPEAFSNARLRAHAQTRSPRPLRNLLRGHGPGQQRRTMLLAVPYLILGGAERLLSALVNHLSACGWHVIIVSTIHSDDSNGDTTSWFEQAAPEIYHLPRFLSPERWKDFVDYLFASRDISVLWIVGSAFFYDYLPALKHGHPDLNVADLLFNPVGHTANNRRYAAFIDLNLVENDEVRQWLIDAGESPERIRLITSGVDLDINHPGPKDEALMAEYGIPPGNVIVGFSGRWSEEKDPLGFVEIAKRLPAGLPVTFVITGTGPLQAELRQAVHNMEFRRGRFVVCGPVPDIGPFLRLYDILLLPSRIDGRPNIVMEALANGAAVIASRVGAVPHMMEEGVQGYLCEPGDYQSFADRIAELATNPGTLSTFRLEARKFAERKLDIRAMVDEYAHCFGTLASEHDAALNSPQNPVREAASESAAS
ncbi:glycosyltransferase [Paraburkholderia dilworthii]|uniref:Glycosyltransferase n=1 Tax=Paraburkholderia dilworthii TaxID=948106 RepID=A0ABW9DHH3_9BURK